MVDNIQGYFRQTPKFQVCNVNNLQAKEIIEYSLQEGYLTAVIDGKRVKTEQDLCQEIGSQMHFPAYYGENWSAMGECLADMDWDDSPEWTLGEIKGGVIIIKNFSDLLSQSTIVGPDDFIKLLENSHRYLFSPVDNISGIPRERMIKVFVEVP
ncbi:barstar family protein [Rothia sp. P5766]|uniref:barstar family protein n=1 Tax=unclassified Rothia (in: high G+C Gram-positive bacteria) TaxID=2689056 RepID=UPI003ABFC8E1